MPGQVRLNTADTPDVMTRLAAIGDRMTADWNTTNTEITGLVGQLGNGDLGAAFLAGYQQAAADTARAVEQHCQQPNQIATAGGQAMTGYTAVDDANQRAAARSATPGQPIL